MIDNSNGREDVNSIALSLLGFKVEVLFEVDESSARVRDTLLEIVGMAGIGMDLMVLFFFCDFYRGLDMLQGLKRVLHGDFGLVALSGLESRQIHPLV